MRVQVDETRHHEQAAGIDGLRAAARQVGADGFDFAAGESDVGDLVAPVCRVEDPTAPQNKFRHLPLRSITDGAYTGANVGKRSARRGWAFPKGA